MSIAPVYLALGRLRILARENPGLHEAALFYERLIPVMLEAEASVPPILVDRLVLEQKLLAGSPLLLGERLPFDAQQISQTMKAICTAFQSAGLKNREVKSTARKLVKVIDTGALDPLLLVTQVERGETGPLADTAARLGLDPGVLELVAENTLKIFFRAWGETIIRQVRLDGWQMGACPVCGSAAGLAEIRGGEGDGSTRGQRFLRCLRCGAGWPYPNLKCAFCGNDDHKSLGVLLVEEQIHRSYVQTCDICGHYIKTVATFEKIPTEMLMVEDLATLSLDILAGEKGFKK
jgi:FdhE protein